MVLKSGLVVFLLLLFAVGHVFAAAGDLDATFGDGGWNSISSIKSFNADLVMQDAVMQPDGKLLVGGYTTVPGHQDAVLLRYNVSGSLDKTFGNAGKVIENFDYLDASVMAVAMQEDKKIVTVSLIDDAFVVVSRYQSGGALDKSFASNGHAVLQAPLFNPLLGVRGVARVVIQADGKIVVGLEVYPDYQNPAIVLLRVNANGLLDENFSDDGWLQTGLNSGNYSKLRLLLQADQKIVVAATAPDRKFVLQRYLVSGAIDSDFGDAGVTALSVGSPGYSDYDVASINGLLQQQDGKLLVAGAACNGQSQNDYCDEDAVLVRYDQQGQLDVDSFGVGGIAWSELKNTSFGYSVFENKNGSFDVAGMEYHDEVQNMFIARLKPDGSRDQSFGKKDTAIHRLPTDASDMIFVRGQSKNTAVIYNREHPSRYFDFIEQQRIFLSGNKNTEFGNLGVVSTKQRVQEAISNDIFLDKNGKFYLSGFVQKQMTDVAVLTRFNQNGRLDKSYANKGFWTLREGQRLMASQHDGKWLVLEQKNTEDFFVKRYKPNRKLDRSFGHAGKVTVPKIDGADLFPQKLLCQPDGKLLLASMQQPAANIRNIYLTRFMPDGSIDLAFADQGNLLLADNWPFLTTLKVGAQGKIIAGIARYTNNSNESQLLRFNTDGSADNIFGDIGARPGLLQGHAVVFVDLVANMDGTILFLANGDEAGFIVGKLNADGSAADDFATNGLAVVAEPDETLFTPATLHLLANGQMLVKGSGSSDSYFESVNLVRLSGNGELDPTFGSGGMVTFRALDNTVPLSTGSSNDMAVLPSGDWLVPFRLEDAKLHVARFHGVD